MPLCGSQNCGCAVTSSVLSITGSGTGADPWDFGFATLAEFDWPYRFASAAARDAAIVSPTEGMTAYLTNTNTKWIYHDGAWDLMWAADELLVSSLGSGSNIDAGTGAEATWLTTSVTIPAWATSAIVRSHLTHIKTVAASSCGYALRHSLGGVDAVSRVYTDSTGDESHEFSWSSLISGFATGAQSLLIKAERTSGATAYRLEQNTSRWFYRIDFQA